ARRRDRRDRPADQARRLTRRAPRLRAPRGCAGDDVEERGGESGRELGIVAVTRDDDALRVELALENVADRLVRTTVVTRDDECRKREPRELGERDLRLPRPALAHQRLDALLELGREG